MKQKIFYNWPKIFFALLLLSVSVFFSFYALKGKSPEPHPVPPENTSRLSENVNVIIQKRYLKCGHTEVWQGGDLPEELAALSFGGLSNGELGTILPKQWQVAEFSPSTVVLESVDQFCNSCLNKSYIGVYDDKIAIFRGIPPDGVVESITEFEVKQDIRDQLEKGIPFSTLEELLLLLESYTS